MSERFLNVVVPMAGRGQRFRDAGYEVPKPLIPVFGRPMYAWAAESLPLAKAARLVFVCLEEDGRELVPDIQERYGEHHPIVVLLPETTSGQLATVLSARRYFDPHLPLVVYNADTLCRGALELEDDTLRGSSYIGAFRAAGDHWSFARTDETGRVVETAEKVRISDWATTGLYHFASTREFLRHADAMVAEDDRTRGEFYVAPLYNRLIAEDSPVRLDRADRVWVLGTPEELEAFLRDGSREVLESP